MTGRKLPLYRAIAMKLCAIEGCKKSNNEEWLDRHTEALEKLIQNHLPSGSGWDLGTRLYQEASNPNRLVFVGGYHHMDEYGGYDGWTDHSVIVKPSLMDGIDIKITGRDRNGIKEYLHQQFHYALTQEVENV